MARMTLTTKQNKRIEKLVKPEYFNTIIIVEKELIKQLSEDELARLYDKLTVVKDLANKLAARMVKGTIKYSSDNWTELQWDEYLEDDLLDSVNYLGLKRKYGTKP